MTIAPHQLQVHICTFVVTKYQLLLLLLLLLQLKSSRKSVRDDRARGFHPLLKGEEEDEENRRHFVDSTLRNVTGHIQNTKWV